MIITEVKKIKIDHECKKHPIYLSWIGVGRNYWLFYNLNTTQSRTRLGTQYGLNINNLETANATEGLITKSDDRRMTIGASIHHTDMDGINALNRSPKVLRLLNPDTWEQEGAKWQPVIIEANSMIQNRTDTSYYDVEFSLRLPELNVISE